MKQSFELRSDFFEKRNLRIETGTDSDLSENQFLNQDYTSIDKEVLAAFQARDYKLPCRVYEADKIESLHVQFSCQSVKFGFFISFTG